MAFLGEFFMTNVTREPSSFVVRLQQMSLQWIIPSRTLRSEQWLHDNGFASVWTCTRMPIQSGDFLKPNSTRRTLIRFSVAMHTSLMSLQLATFCETFVTKRTTVRLVSSVDSQVYKQISGESKRFVTVVTFVWFLSSMNSAVFNELPLCRKSFTTNWISE